MAATWIAVLLLTPTLAADSARSSSIVDGDALLAATEGDMSKLNEFLQADKENEINTESLCASLTPDTA